MKHFFGLKLEGMCKLFFGPKVECLDTTEDAGLTCNRLDTQVSSLDMGHLVLYVSMVYFEIHPWPGMAQQGGENQVSGTTSRRLAWSHHGQDA